MKAVQLTRRLALEQAVQVADGAGGFSRAWLERGRLWAEVVAGTGRETGGEEVVISALALRVTVRAAPEGSDARPKAGQRFREGGRVYAILAVAERDAAGLYLTCTCREEALT